MATQPRGEDSPQATDGPQEAMPPVAVGLGGKIEEQYRKIKEHAETYPYVWGSYILVYGGLGLWFTYRWRKLRQTEDRVRVLQEKLRRKFEVQQPTTSAAAVTEQSTKSASLTNKTPPSAADKADK